MSDLILILNCGSSSIKFAVFEAASPLPRKPLWNGKVQGIGGPAPDFGETGVPPFAIELRAEHPYRDALRIIRERITARLQDRPVAAIAHRVVHGGVFFDRAIRLDAAALAQLETLIPLAPLHQPVGLAAIAAVTQLAPDLPQIACFDTAFHTTQDPLATRFGIAQHWHEAGVRRYSFHGLSYAAIARQLPATLGTVAEGQVVVLHLGSGSSACVLHHGRSVATSMGMSAAEGLMMGTRPGNLDPEVVLWWMENSGMDIAAVRRELYKASGLLGVSGLSADLRDLLASPRPEAELAIELYCYRAAREVGALAVQAGGLDALVFTAGVGEHSAEVRQRILARLAWLGFSLDPAANLAHATCLTTADSRLSAWVIPTDEEGQMAREAAAVLGVR